MTIFKDDTYDGTYNTMQLFPSLLDTHNLYPQFTMRYAMPIVIKDTQSLSLRYPKIQLLCLSKTYHSYQARHDDPKHIIFSLMFHTMQL